jgi:release factor glutamine methyltransferase
MKLIRILFFLFVVFYIIYFLIVEKVMVQVNPEAEKYISLILNRKVPYQIPFFSTTIIVDDVNVYPPGKITTLFGQYLIENNLIKDKVFADIGVGCFGLGILAAKNGAKIAIGTCISDNAMRCAKNNIALNEIKNARLFEGKGSAPLLSNFGGKVDIIASGPPWDYISKEEFITIPKDRQVISRAFYDIDDEFMNDLMTNGFKLLTPNGKMFITSSLRVLGRVKELCRRFNLNYKIVKEADLHGDGNIHYILVIYRE